jgi:hypothetical protein
MIWYVSSYVEPIRWLNGYRVRPYCGRCSFYPRSDYINDNKMGISYTPLGTEVNLVFALLQEVVT